MRDVSEPPKRRWLTKATDGIVLLSFSAICVGMLMTVGDVLTRLASRIAGALIGGDPGWGLVGLVDLTQLTMMIGAPLAIAAAFFAGAHIRVDLVYALLGPAMRRLVLRLSALLAALFLGLCLYTAWNEMRGQLDFTTTSATLGLAYTWYWLPLIGGLAVSVLGCVIIVILAPEEETPDV
jgi:TRAP-type mannitol/chloroaromatic compound transport system permease small subunit